MRLAEGLKSFGRFPVVPEILQLVVEPGVTIRDLVLDAAELHLLQSKYIPISLQFRCVSRSIAHVPNPCMVLSEEPYHFSHDSELTGSS
jgi:hypothetical protein